MSPVHAAVGVHSGELLLVNARHPLPLAYRPARGLRPALGSEAALLESRAARALALCCESAGVARHIQAVSGYRNRREQAALYAESERENGPEFTARYVALPGCSEHETGLAIDLGQAGSVDFIRPELPDTGPFAVLRAALPGYGFVLRYPEDKTHVTGIGYEPWHFRYVGWPHAVVMCANGWVLEEYITRLGGCGYSSPLRYEQDGRRMLVYTLAEHEAAEAAVQLTEEGGLWQMSGNNVDGVVVTQWL